MVHLPLVHLTCEKQPSANCPSICRYIGPLASIMMGQQMPILLIYIIITFMPRFVLIVTCCSVYAIMPLLHCCPSAVAPHLYVRCIVSLCAPSQEVAKEMIWFKFHLRVLLLLWLLQLVLVRLSSGAACLSGFLNLKHVSVQPEILLQQLCDLMAWTTVGFVAFWELFSASRFGSCQLS